MMQKSFKNIKSYWITFSISFEYFNLFLCVKNSITISGLFIVKWKNKANLRKLLLNHNDYLDTLIHGEKVRTTNCCLLRLLFKMCYNYLDRLMDTWLLITSIGKRLLMSLNYPTEYSVCLYLPLYWSVNGVLNTLGMIITDNLEELSGISIDSRNHFIKSTGIISRFGDSSKQWGHL